MHHLALRYNYTKNRSWFAPNASSMDGGTRSAYGRTSQYAMSYANSMYAMDNLVHSFLNRLKQPSVWKSVQPVLATYSKLNDQRYTIRMSSHSLISSMVQALQATISLWVMNSSTWNNAVHNTIWNVKDDVTYFFGKHKLTGGLSYEHQLADNQYMRNGTGYYRYSSVDDFLNGLHPR